VSTITWISFLKWSINILESAWELEAIRTNRVLLQVIMPDAFATGAAINIIYLLIFLYVRAADAI
jgi:hypothetical protein